MQWSNDVIAIRQDYEYCPRGRGWAVYRRTTYRKGADFPPQLFSVGEKVAQFHTREEARRETYRLNGWHYTEKKR